MLVRDMPRWFGRPVPTRGALLGAFGFPARGTNFPPELAQTSAQHVTNHRRVPGNGQKRRQITEKAEPDHHRDDPEGKNGIDGEKQIFPSVMGHGAVDYARNVR